VLAVRAFYSGEALMQITAFEVFPYHMGNYRSIKAILLLEKIVVVLLELEKVAVKKFPEGGFPRFPPPVDLHIATAFHPAPFLPVKEQG
jgi:hypothetical protein